MEGDEGVKKKRAELLVGIRGVMRRWEEVEERKGWRTLRVLPVEPGA